MFQYGNNISVKFPCPEIILQGKIPSDETKTFRVTAIIDTGAIMSCVPAKAIESIVGADFEYNLVTVRGACGTSEYRKSYIIHLKLANCEFRDLEVIAIDKPYALIGRDILNKYKLTFDAPNSTWDVDTKCDQ